jgi:hypothetical protein
MSCKSIAQNVPLPEFAGGTHFSSDGAFVDARNVVHKMTQRSFELLPK